VSDMSRKILKMMFLLSVSILVFTGCGKQETETVAETEITTEAKATQETSIPEETQMTGTTPAETEKEEETQSPVETESTEVPETTAGNDSGQREDNQQPQQTEQPSAAQEPSEPEKPAETEKPEQPEETVQSEKSEPASYNPQRVVELAVEQTKAQGKIYIPDDLSQMLENGEISQEDYDACYPADGAGYLEYYVATDMNEARDISGTVQFSSESDIAANIAGMYAALPQQYFYIEYHGTVMYGDRECYVFYCYRA